MSLVFFASSAGRPVDVRALFFLLVEFCRKADRTKGHIERPPCQEEEVGIEACVCVECKGVRAAT